MQELIDFRGPSHDLEVFAKRYRENEMEPIDALKNLKGLSLNIVVHFQKQDEMLSNRDDLLFFQRLEEVNRQGTTQLFVGEDGGHLAPHRSLWEYLNPLLKR